MKAMYDWTLALWEGSKPIHTTEPDYYKDNKQDWDSDESEENSIENYDDLPNTEAPKAATTGPTPSESAVFRGAQKSEIAAGGGDASIKTSFKGIPPHPGIVAGSPQTELSVKVKSRADKFTD